MHPSLLPMLLPLALASPLDDAAAVLSRFPAGRVPQTDAVVSAIETLGRRGTDAERSLLGQLTRDESGRIAGAAARALEDMDARARAAERMAFAAALQLAAPSGSSVDPRGALGPAETTALAYAHTVLGPAKGPVVEVLEPVPPARARQLVAAAEETERTHGPAASLPLYLQAAVSGETDGLIGLTALGVDAELLILGMSAFGGQAPAVQLDPVQLDLVAVGASDRSVEVLIERATAEQPLVRMAALDGLATLVLRAGVSPDAQARARRALLDAQARPTLRHGGPIAPTTVHR